jgi:hypothetical protein
MEKQYVAPVVAVAMLIPRICMAQASWTQRSGCATSIGSNGNTTWVTGCDSTQDKTFYHSCGTNCWQNEPGFKGVQVIVTAGSAVFGINSAGTISIFNDGWSPFDGCARSIGAGSDFNSLWAGGCDGWVYKFNNDGSGTWSRSFQPSGDSVRNVGVFSFSGGFFEPIVATNSGAVWTLSFFGWGTDPTPPGGAAFFSDHYIIDGRGEVNVWSANEGGWCNGLTQIPGHTLKQVAGQDASPGARNSSPWVIDTSGNIFQYNCNGECDCPP